MKKPFPFFMFYMNNMTIPYEGKRTEEHFYEWAIQKARDFSIEIKCDDIQE
jgi:hypothetical protein